MIHCAIIGTGQIGSRHLQALARLTTPVRIELTDPSSSAMRIAQERFKEIAPPNSASAELILLSSIGGLSEGLDLVIVATHSDIRAQVTEKLVNTKSVKNLILEKVLFQKPGDYFSTKELLQNKNIPTWVSCWMRTTELFKQIKSAIKSDHPVHMSVEGSRWGMGTNSIHFLDLFSFFTECADFKFTEVQLDGKARDSKRAGFKEFMGSLTGLNPRGDSLSLDCNDEEEGPVTIRIKNGPEKYQVVTDFSGYVEVESTDGLARRMGKTSLPYQSQMTHLWVENILAKGSCDLPTYSDSMGLHLELIRVFSDHFQKITGKGIDACPIT